MTVSREWMGQVRRVLEDIEDAAAKKRAAAQEAPESQARRAFELYEFNAGMVPLEQTPRARAEREILRIAWTYGWQPAVSRYLDAQAAPSLSALTDDQVEQLLERMQRYLDCAMTAGDFDEALPAR